MKKIRKILTDHVDFKANGFAIMGFAVVSLYGSYALIRDTVIAFMEMN